MPLFSFKHCIGSSQVERVTFHETLAELRETSYFPIFLLLRQIKESIKEASLDTILLGDTKIGKPTSPTFILLYVSVSTCNLFSLFHSVLYTFSRPP